MTNYLERELYNVYIVSISTAQAKKQVGKNLEYYEAEKLIETKKGLLYDPYEYYLAWCVSGSEMDRNLFKSLTGN